MLPSITHLLHTWLRHKH